MSEVVPLPSREDALLAAAQRVVDLVTYDDSGNEARGGNGGLLSRETIRAVDELRVLLLRVRK